MPRTRKPVSPERIEANRSNATHSTGPRTAEGKARAAQNARKHGFTPASFSVIHLEDVESLDNLKADLVAFYQPVNSQELFALERIALAQFALLRCSALEAGFFTSCLNTTLNADGSACHFYTDDVSRDTGVAQAQIRSYRLADGFQRQAAKSNGWTLFLRYQAQAERLYRRAVEEFERLRALRDAFPNEPTIDPEPEETKPLPPPETNPLPPANPNPNPVGRTPWSAPDPLVAPSPGAAAPPPIEPIAFHPKRSEHRSACQAAPPPYRGVMRSTTVTSDRLHTVTPSHTHTPAPEASPALAFHAARLRRACQAGYAFGFALLRAVLAAMADRLPVCPPLGVELGG